MAVIFSFHYFDQLENRSMLITETFNEVITLCLIYLVMCFNGDFVSELETRNKLGYVYISLILFNISTHLFLLLISNVYMVKYALRKRLYRRRMQTRAPRPITQDILAELAENLASNKPEQINDA